MDFVHNSSTEMVGRKGDNFWYTLEYTHTFSRPWPKISPRKKPPLCYVKITIFYTEVLLGKRVIDYFFIYTNLFLDVGIIFETDVGGEAKSIISSFSIYTFCRKKNIPIIIIAYVSHEFFSMFGR